MLRFGMIALVLLLATILAPVPLIGTDTPTVGPLAQANLQPPVPDPTDTAPPALEDTAAPGVPQLVPDPGSVIGQPGPAPTQGPNSLQPAPTTTLPPQTMPNWPPASESTAPAPHALTQPQMLPAQPSMLPPGMVPPGMPQPGMLPGAPQTLVPVQPAPAVAPGVIPPPPGTLGQTYRRPTRLIPFSRHPRAAVIEITGVPRGLEVTVQGLYLVEDLEGFRATNGRWQFESNDPLMPGLPHVYRVMVWDPEGHLYEDLVRYVRLIPGRIVELEY